MTSEANESAPSSANQSAEASEQKQPELRRTFACASINLPATEFESTASLLQPMEEEPQISNAELEDYWQQYPEGLQPDYDALQDAESEYSLPPVEQSTSDQSLATSSLLTLSGASPNELTSSPTEEEDDFISPPTSYSRRSR